MASFFSGPGNIMVTIYSSIMNSNKSVYFAEPNTQWFCTNQSSVGNVVSQKMLI